MPGSLLIRPRSVTLLRPIEGQAPGPHSDGGRGCQALANEAVCPLLILETLKSFRDFHPTLLSSGLGRCY
jgi:hypothetical protein